MSGWRHVIRWICDVMSVTSLDSDGMYMWTWARIIEKSKSVISSYSVWIRQIIIVWHRRALTDVETVD